MADAPKQPSIIAVDLDERTVARRNAEVEQERAVAIYDLLEDNHFRPVDHPEGSFRLRLGMEDNRLIFDVRDTADQPVARVPLPILPFRKIVKEYFMVCEAYYEAIRHAPPSKIEAVDMGRRGLHDQGSTMLRERLATHIEIDHNTARRLFTLLCVLQIRQ
ncbi:MAG: UPF0262 family protein [Pseudomonadota bacterium]